MPGNGQALNGHGEPRSLAQIANDLADAMLAGQKARLSTSLNEAARMVRGASSSIDGAPQIGACADAAAESLERVASTIRERQVGDYVADMEQVIRRNPAGAVAGAALAGFALSRFLRSERAEGRGTDSGEPA